MFCKNGVLENFTRQKLDVIGRREWGVSECSGRPIFIFLIEEHWICSMNRYHAESSINILLTRNLLFDSDIRRWRHPLMIPLHYLLANLNNRMRGQFECDVTCFHFCFEILCSHALCRCCSIVCLRFQVVQIKQIYYKSSTKNVVVINERYFVIFLNNFLKLDNLNERHMCIIPY